MSTNNICFRGEIRKISAFSDEKCALSVVMLRYIIWAASSRKVPSNMCKICRLDPPVHMQSLISAFALQLKHSI